MKHWTWILRMAVKDAAKSKNRLAVYMASIVLGIASLVAIESFKRSVTTKINADTKELLGADLIVRSNHPLTPKETQLIHTLGGVSAFEKSFASMMTAQKNGTTRLVNVKALKGNFPFYGQIQTAPQVPSGVLYSSPVVFVDQTVMLQMELQVGDQIQLGNASFEVKAAILKAPGQSGVSSSVAPPVYISQDHLQTTGLIKTGSRILYRQYLYFGDNPPTPQALTAVEDQLFGENVRIETIEQRKEDLGEAFGYLNNFLNLVGFIALLLGCIGVASSVRLYLKEKQTTIATLRCLGTSSRVVFGIFFFEILALGVLGSVLGAALGSALQVVLPYLLRDVLVVEVDFVFSPMACLSGIAIGVLSSVLFTLESLLSIKNIPPLLAINSSAELAKERPTKYLPRLALVLFVFGFSLLQTNDWKLGAVFTGATGFVFGLLALLSVGFKKGVTKHLPTSLPYVFRQGLANTARPQNQSTELTVSIGMGALLMTLLFSLQGNLISQLTLADEDQQPNLILFDVQTHQHEAVESLLTAHQMPTIQKVPIVAMRLDEIKGRTRLELKKDSLLKMPSHVLNREYRVSYRGELSSTEEVVEGEFTADASGLGMVPVSLEKRTAKQMQVTLGDTLVFNVQGVPLGVVVGSIRKVNWNKMQTNFTVLFPKGVLENAPQTYAYVSRTENREGSAAFQSASVKTLPNVSVIDLSTVLQTVNEVVGKITLVIRFMAFICILTGFMVLMGTISNSKFQRLKEVVLLRTLGSSKKQIILITLTEYLSLGILSALSGIVLGLLSSGLLVTFVFELPFWWHLWPLVWLLGSITGVVGVAGYWNNRAIFKQSPLEVLRRDGA